MIQLLEFRHISSGAARYILLEDRLWSGAIEDENGCWVWMRSRNHKGYGDIGYEGRVRRAHRVAYEIAKGPIPEGLVIDHLCRNRACINPTHLEVVTPRENILRGNSLAAVAVRTNHCHRGHELTGENVTSLGAGRGRACRACRRIRYREAKR